MQTQPEVATGDTALDAAYAAYAVAAVVAAVALRMVLVAMYSAFWYVAAFSVLGFVAAAVVLGPLEALALAISVAKVTAKVAMGAWRGLRLFLKAGGVGPVVVALLAGAYSTRAVFRRERRRPETADKGTMTERRTATAAGRGGVGRRRRGRGRSRVLRRRRVWWRRVCPPVRLLAHGGAEFLS